jgi:glycosyltransferase involved in cell wall biosynthesis
MAWWLSRPIHRVRLVMGWYPVVRNVNRADERTTARRALLLYRLKPFQLPADHPEFLRHHNMHRARWIAALLGEFGYIVDAANGRNARRRRPRGAYDIVITDRADLAASFDPGTRRIFLATTPDHATRNASVRRRHAALEQRRGCRLPPDRIHSEVVPFASGATAIIGIGTPATTGTWRRVSRAPIHHFDAAAFPCPRTEGKDFERARRHFLFFASRTQVLKGLDLLLEIFPRHPDLHLHVCSSFAAERAFCACYRRELFDTPNVHPVGWIAVNGPEFRRLAAEAACIVHPSAAEGQAGSVVQCLAAGLIPLVTRETGVETGDVGETFTSDRLDDIERTILDVASRPASWHEEHSRRARRLAETRFSEAAFMARWRSMLTEVLEQQPGGTKPAGTRQQA